MSPTPPATPPEESETRRSLRQRLDAAQEEDDRRRRRTRIVFMAVAFGALLWLGVRWASPRVAPDLLLAARGNLSRAHAELFRKAALEGRSNEFLRFFDEVPGAPELYRDFARRYPDRAIHTILDPEVRRANLAHDTQVYHSVGFSSLEDTIDAMEPQDWPLVHKTSDDTSRHSRNLEAMLGLDFERAREATLALPPNRAALITLVRWGVPRAEVQRAAKRLDTEGEWTAAEYRKAGVTPPDEALGIRLILEDQTVADPIAEIRRAGLPVPKLDPPLDRPRDTSLALGVRRVTKAFPPGRHALKGEWLSYAHSCLVRDRSDVNARAYLHRALDTPWSITRYWVRGALIEDGDPEALKRARQGLASQNAGTLVAALKSCRGDAAVPLLLDLQNHPWPWVRIRAVDRLRAIGTPIAKAALRVYARNSCRDARLLAAGRQPFAIGEGITHEILARPYRSRDGSNVYPDVTELR